MTIERLEFLFNEAKEHNQRSMEEFIQQKRYYNGDQLPESVKAILAQRGQPELYENIYHKIGNKIIGFKLAGKQDIKVIGRQREDKNIAQMLTDILKSITDTEEYALQKHDCDIDLLLGLGVWQVCIRELEEEDILGVKFKEVYLKHIPSESFLIDPTSQRRDAEDAKYFHKILKIERDDYLELFPKSKYVFSYAENKREFVNVVESWVLDKNEWKRVYWEKDFKEKLREDDNPYGFGHPFAIRKFNVSFDGQYYGLFRHIKPLQDAINFSSIKLANKLGSIKVVIEEGSVQDVETFAEHFSRDDSVSLVKDGGIRDNRMQVINQNADIAQIGQSIIEYRRQADLLTGLNEEALGQAVNRLSGYAIEQRQNVGLIGIQQYIEGSNSIDRAAFMKVIFLIKKFYTAEQVFNIVEKEDAYKEFVVNKIKRDEFGVMILDEWGLPLRENVLMDIGHYDITLKTVPQTQGSMSERYKNNIELMKIVAQTAPQIVPMMLPLILKDAQSPISDEVVEMIKNLNTPNPQAQQAQAQLEQIEMQRNALELQLLQAKAEKLQADTAKAQADGLRRLES